MRKLTYCCVAVALVAGLASMSRAAFVFQVVQVGGDVVVTGSGSLDTTGLTLGLSNFGVGNNGIHPATANLFVGPNAAPNVDAYSGYTGPSSFGSGDSTSQSSGTGDEVLLLDSANYIGVPAGYVSGSALSDSGLYSGASFASLGITPGTYVYNWGTGIHADSLTVNAVPEPGPTALLGMGVAGWGSSGVRRRRPTARG